MNNVKHCLLSLLLVLSLFGIRLVMAEESLSDEQIANIIIQQSIRNFTGECPCPYNLDHTGERCGNHSAWGKPGKVSPLCFASDVSNKMIDNYRTRQGKLGRSKKK